MDRARSFVWQCPGALEPATRLLRAAGERRPCKSLHLPQQLPRLTQQRLNLLSPGDGMPCKQAVFARVPVAPRRAGSRRTTVHAAAPLAAHRRRAARFPGADFGAATRARQHRNGTAGVIAHARACRLASVRLCANVRSRVRILRGSPAGGHAACSSRANDPRPNSQARAAGIRPRPRRRS